MAMVQGFSTTVILHPLSDQERKCEVTQSSPTLCKPMDCSLPGSSVHGILQARIPESGAIPFLQGIFQTQGLNLSLLHCRQILYHLSHGNQRVGLSSFREVRIRILKPLQCFLLKSIRL